MVSLNIHIWLTKYTYMCTVEASGSVGLPRELHYLAVTGEQSEAQRAGEPVPGSTVTVTHSGFSFPQYYFVSRTLAVLVFYKS